MKPIKRHPNRKIKARRKMKNDREITVEKVADFFYAS